MSHSIDAFIANRSPGFHFVQALVKQIEPGTPPEVWFSSSSLIVSPNPGEVNPNGPDGFS